MNNIISTTHEFDYKRDYNIHYNISGKLIITIGDNTFEYDKTQLIELLTIQKRCDAMEEKIKWMQDRFEQLWWAPGMPGAVEAAADFTENIH